MEKPTLKKITFIGDSQVGKTSIIHRFLHRSFTEPYVETYAIDFYSGSIEKDDEIYHLQI